MVAGCLYRTIFHGKRVVCLTASLGSKVKSQSKRKSFYCRNTKDERSNLAFHTVKHRVTDAGRKPTGGTFDHTAYRIKLIPCLWNQILHPFSGTIIQNRKELFLNGKQCFTVYQNRVKRTILDRADRSDVCSNLDAKRAQILFCDASSKTERCGETSRKMSSAPNIIKAMVTDKTGVIGMTRSCHRTELVIVFGLGIGIFN